MWWSLCCQAGMTNKGSPMLALPNEVALSIEFSEVIFSPVWRELKLRQRRVELQHSPCSANARTVLNQARDGIGKDDVWSNGERDAVQQR